MYVHPARQALLRHPSVQPHPMVIRPSGSAWHSLDVLVVSTGLVELTIVPWLAGFFAGFSQWLELPGLGINTTSSRRGLSYFHDMASIWSIYIYIYIYTQVYLRSFRTHDPVKFLHSIWRWSSCLGKRMHHLRYAKMYHTQVFCISPTLQTLSPSLTRINKKVKMNISWIYTPAETVTSRIITSLVMGILTLNVHSSRLHAWGPGNYGGGRPTPGRNKVLLVTIWFSLIWLAIKPLFLGGGM